MIDTPRCLVAEALGTALLVATIVGSGIMADRLTGDPALTLLCNTLPTGAILVVLISILGPVSGAHFNPAVTAVSALRREMEPAKAIFYCVAQLAGGLAGTILAHLMFARPLLQLSTTERHGANLWLAEAVAAFGLVSVVVVGARTRPIALPVLVGLYITAAYWFTASTSFANPAVTLVRSLTDSFAGIRPIDVPAFVAAQLVGSLAAALVAGWMIEPLALPQNAEGKA